MFRIAGWLFCLVVVGSSCDSEPKILTQEERLKINQMYNAEIKELRRNSDSLCDLFYQQWFDNAVDSIRNERMEEIELLMKDKTPK